jgi:peptidoglycan/xylan/chitin deacetylase (PgdA/CDA1 family)
LESNKNSVIIIFSLSAAVIGILSLLSFAGFGFLPNLLATSIDTKIDYDKAVILNFDDSLRSQHTNAKPILDKYGFKATFYVVCNYIGKNDGYMNWNQIQTLHREGHDIASHGMNHVHLEELPWKDIEYQVRESKRCLQNHGVNATSFAYPFNGGSDDRSVIDTVAKYYELARTGNDALAYLRCNSAEVQPSQTDCRTYTDGDDLTYANRYTIRAWSHDFEKVENSYSDNEMLDEFIRIVNSQTKYNNAGIINAIPIIIYHRVGDSGGIYNTELKLFDAQMKYLHDNGFKVLTMADLAYDEKSNYLYVKDFEQKPVVKATSNILEVVQKPTSNTTSSISEEEALKQVSIGRTNVTETGNLIMDAFYYLFGWK